MKNSFSFKALPLIAFPVMNRNSQHYPLFSGENRRFAFFRLLSPPVLLLAATLLFSLIQQSAVAQTDSAQSPVGWEFSSDRGPDGKNTLIVTAHIKPGYELYSTTMPDTLGNSRITLDSGAAAAIIDIEEKGDLKTVKDPTFNNALARVFTGSVKWLVNLQSKEGMSGDLKGKITFMATNTKDSSFAGPIEVPFRFAHNADGSFTAKSATLSESTAGASSLKKTTIDLAHPVNDCGGTGAEGAKSLISIFFLGILGGLVGLIMPCTFPMIPLTVSFFTKRAASRKKGIANAFLYGFFIFLIYTLISVPFYFIKGSNNANVLNTISTSVGLNIFFAVVFVAFALSFFGLYEITLPGSLSNSVDSKANMGSIGGIFFMALTLAIVSFSCTGPILGTFLVGALSSGGAVPLTVAMAGFGLALGLPFALFALFPSWLQSLPRSGSWMDTVKKVFGFVELALALKYLSNADLVTHWGLLKRETFFGIWILIGLALSAYLFGIIKFGHDSGPVKPSKGRIGFGLLFLAFVIYLAPGLTNGHSANRALVSGFPPPLSYSLYKDHVKEVEPDMINDYEKALALAKAQHKPLLIDFTGWACVNCRKMEENVWPERAVKDLIKKDYILVSLYVDDRKKLADDEQFIFTGSDGSKKEIRTVGDKYATLQSENFKVASQPYYVIINPDEKLLTHPVAYTPNAQQYADWLKCGLDAYKKQ